MYPQTSEGICPAYPSRFIKWLLQLNSAFIRPLLIEYPFSSTFIHVDQEWQLVPPYK